MTLKFKTTGEQGNVRVVYGRVTHNTTGNNNCYYYTCIRHAYWKECVCVYSVCSVKEYHVQYLCMIDTEPGTVIYEEREREMQLHEV